MTDTYAKLLGLSGSTPSSKPGAEKPAESPPPPEKNTRVLAKKQPNKAVTKPPVKNLTGQPGQDTPLPVSPLRTSPPPPDTSLLTTKEKTKYGTYLTDESIQKISIRAIQTNRDAHQIVQEAVNQYFKALEK